MFYAHFVLSKRGPLARIWLAAHWDKKLTKAHVFETNLEDTVETIISPQVKMALRTSGHLLLGVVRIYNRKAKYLLADCNEAFVKIKMAFRPGVVDLPEESREAQHNQIYIVEEFPNFDAPLPDITDIDVTRHLTLNQSRIDEITMPDEVPTTLQLDEGFGDMMELGRNVDDHYGAGDLHSMFYKDDVPKQGKDLSFMEGPAGLKDGFGAMDDGGILGESFLKGPGLFGEEQDGGFLGEGTSRKSPEEEVPMETAEGAMDNQMMSPAPAPQQPVEEAELLPQQEQTTATDTAAVAEDENKVVEQEREPEVAQPQPEVAQHQQEAVQEQAVVAQYRVEEQPNLVPEQQPQQVISEEAQEDPSMNKDQTTLVANEEEAFALEPLDVTGVKDVRIRRKRKLIVDHLMELDGQTMRDQLKDFNDIVTTLDMAPPTKRLMQWKDMGGVDKLFTFPSRMCGDVGNKIFANNLHITIPSDLIDVTGTQLHEKFGEIPDVETTATTTIVEHEESSIQVARDLDESSFPAAPPQHIDQSNELMLQNKDLSMNQINAPVAYNSEDEYEPYSIGPQSVASNLGGGGSLGAASPANPMPQLEDPLHLPAMGDMFEPDMPPPPAPEAEEPELPEPPLPEEEEGEAYADDVEDLRWNKRTQHLLHHLQRNFKREPEVTFFQLTDGVTRKQAVSKFYSMLVLAKQEATLLAQSHVFGDVYIRQGPKFDSLLM